MKITEMLVRLGLLQTAPPPAQAPAEDAAIPTRVVSLRELTGEIDEEKRSAERLFDPEAWDLRDHDGFGDNPLPHGWTSLKVMEALRDGQPAKVLEQLKAHSVDVHDVLEEAHRRDQALDAHEAHLQQQVKQLEAEAQRRRSSLEAEIAQKQQLLRDLEGSVTRARARVQEWLDRKHGLEDELEGAMKHLAENLQKEDAK